MEIIIQNWDILRVIATILKYRSRYKCLIYRGFAIYRGIKRLQINKTTTSISKKKEKKKKEKKRMKPRRCDTLTKRGWCSLHVPA